jgi:hypothetical protein
MPMPDLPPLRLTGIHGRSDHRACRVANGKTHACVMAQDARHAIFQHRRTRRPTAEDRQRHFQRQAGMTGHAHLFGQTREIALHHRVVDRFHHQPGAKRADMKDPP